jgi:hypothetical protein
MARQGSALSEYSNRRIVALLTSTEMTIEEIATRMGCSRSKVSNINREHQVRDYAGARSQWRVMQNLRDRRQFNLVSVPQIPLFARPQLLTASTSSTASPGASSV